MIKATVLSLAVTAYIPAKPTGATGEQILAGLTMAVSQDQRHMLRKWWYVEGFGWRYAQDVMHRRWKQKLDIAVNDVGEAKEIGISTRRIHGE